MASRTNKQRSPRRFGNATGWRQSCRSEAVALSCDRRNASDFGNSHHCRSLIGFCTKPSVTCVRRPFNGGRRIVIFTPEAEQRELGEFLRFLLVKARPFGPGRPSFSRSRLGRGAGKG